MSPSVSVPCLRQGSPRSPSQTYFLKRRAKGPRGRLQGLGVLRLHPLTSICVILLLPGAHVLCWSNPPQPCPPGVSVPASPRCSSEHRHFQHHRLGLLALVAFGENRGARGQVSSAVAVFFFPPWGDLTKVAGCLSAGSIAHVLSTHTSRTHARCSELQGPHRQACLWKGLRGEPPWFTPRCVTGSVSAGGDPGRAQWGPRKYPENVSNSLALSSVLQPRDRDGG